MVPYNHLSDKSLYRSAPDRLDPKICPSLIDKVSKTVNYEEKQLLPRKKLATDMLEEKTLYITFKRYHIYLSQLQCKQFPDPSRGKKL